MIFGNDETETPYATEEELDEVLPDQSKDGLHYKFSPSLDFIREMAKNDPKGVDAIWGMEYSKRRCGVWEFCHRKDDGTIVEQCDECGEYRTREEL